MSRIRASGVFVVVGLLAAGCNSVDDVTSSTTSESAAAYVESAANRVSEAPVVLQAADLVSQVWPQALTCPASFDLGNGITGGCALYTGDAMYEYNAEAYWWMPTDATLASGAATVQVHFDAAVFQPTWAAASEYHCRIDSGTTQWAGGSLTWRASGAVSDGSLGVSTRSGEWRTSASAISLPATSPVPVTAQIDRASGTGAITHAGVVVASIAVNGGCVTVDFVDPQREDRESCLW